MQGSKDQINLGWGGKEEECSCKRGSRPSEREKERQRWKERERVWDRILCIQHSGKQFFLRAVANTPEPRSWLLRSQASVTLAGDLAK